MNLCVQSGGLTGHYPISELFQHIADAGFSSVDLNIDTAISRNVLMTRRNQGLTIYEKSMPEICAYFQPQIDAIKAAGLYIYQAHAHFPACSPKEDVDMLDYSIELYKKQILLCQYMNCGRLVIHPIVYNHTDKAHTPEFVNELNMKLYTSLIDTLKQTDVTVCLENLFYGYNGMIMEGPCCDTKETCAMIDKLNEMAGKECFGFCVDTGHLNLLGKNQYSYITALGKRIKAFHVHDNDGKSDQHLAPYAGVIDWDDFCRALKDIGYDGDIDFETFAQYRPEKIPDKRAVLPWLNLVAEMGRVFIRKIKE